jgi:salicylate hydroxylase
MASSLTTTPKLSLDIIIVGAGIGGLTVAHRLATAGHKVTVIEGAQTLGEIGAGMLLSPNVTRLLWRWGFGERLKEVIAVQMGLTYRRCTFHPLVLFDIRVLIITVFS